MFGIFRAVVEFKIMYAFSDLVFIIERRGKTVIIRYAVSASAKLFLTAAGRAYFALHKRQRIAAAFTRILFRIKNQITAENTPFRPKEGFDNFNYV